MAIENAQLYRQLREFATADERERIGRDLHDGPLQEIYGAGLRIESVLERLRQGDLSVDADFDDLAGEVAAAVGQAKSGATTNSPGIGRRLNDALRRVHESDKELREELNSVIEDLNHVVRDMRATIFQLRPEGGNPGLRERLEALVEGMGSQFLMKIVLRITGVKTAFTPALTDDLCFIARDALTNAYRHGGASSALIRLNASPELVEMEVTDEGIGLPEGSKPGLNAGFGLTNIRYRVERHGGVFQIGPNQPKGARLSVVLPLSGEKRDG